MTEQRSGWVTFAGALLLLAGILNVIYGIAAIGDSKFFIQDQKYILSNLNTWGWVTLILGVLQFIAAFAFRRRPLRADLRNRRGRAQPRSARCCRFLPIRSGRSRSSPSTSSSSTRSQLGGPREES